MADYREISQSYAAGAIKSAILINGGAAVAVLSQISNLSAIAAPTDIAKTMLVFIFGVIFATVTWGCGFFSTRHVDRALRGEDADFAKANSFMMKGVIFFALSLFSFLLGALWLVFSVQ